MTEEQYADLLQQQDHKCAICGLAAGASKQRLAVDHNHATGQVRGLLCRRCNLGIGQLKDSVELLRKAIDYLESQDAS